MRRCDLVGCEGHFRELGYATFPSIAPGSAPALAYPVPIAHSAILCIVAHNHSGIITAIDDKQ